MAFILGCLVGGIITCVIFRFFLVGTLHIDRTNPYEDPYFFLELDRIIGSKEYIMLRVNNSQE